MKENLAVMINKRVISTQKLSGDGLPGRRVLIGEVVCRMDKQKQEE